MAQLQSKINPRSEAFRAHAAAMQALVDDLNTRLAKIAEGGGADARAKHLARGKLLPRERVERLLDPDTPFLEIAPLAALGLYPEVDRSGNTVDAAPCAGLIAGIGRVAGVELDCASGPVLVRAMEGVALPTARHPPDPPAQPGLPAAEVAIVGLAAGRFSRVELLLADHSSGMRKDRNPELGAPDGLGP
jgi:3-methylcrotonyl-CoA carboxylase beta subunit